MPTSAPAVKRWAVEGYGAVIHDCEPTLQAREETLEKVVAATGANFVHPYNDWRIIAGQGTCALELLEQAPDLDLVMTPVGGGGRVRLNPAMRRPPRASRGRSRSRRCPPPRISPTGR